MPCHFVKKNRPFPVKITICSPHALWYHGKKGMVSEKGGFYDEKYRWRSRRHFEPIDTDTHLGFSYLHAYTDALSSTYWAEKYRYLPIPLIVVIIASILIELAIIYQKELAAYFHWNTKETKGQ